MEERQKHPHRPQALRDDDRPLARPACPVCGGHLEEIRGKLLCRDCHTIYETCCEGGRG